MIQRAYQRYIIAGFVLTLVSLLLLTAVWLLEENRMASSAAELRAESIARGRGLYLEGCTSCHGSIGEGGIGPALNNKLLLEAATDQILFATIDAGRPGTTMPAWGQSNGGPYTDEDLRDLVTFIRSWESTAPVVDVNAFEPDAQRGAALFESTCFVCHGSEGIGTDIAPPINDPSRLASLDNDWYRATIKNGRPAKGMPTWGTVLSPNQIEDLIALLDAWREGERVAAESSARELLEAALFALSQGDIPDTLFYLERAEPLLFGPATDLFDEVVRDIDRDRPETALAKLSVLVSDWPIGDADAGERVFRNNCLSCHGVEGSGGVGPALADNLFIQENTNGQLLIFILDGRPGTAMQGFESELSEEEIANLIALLKDWQTTQSGE